MDRFLCLIFEFIEKYRNQPEEAPSRFGTIEQCLNLKADRCSVCLSRMKRGEETRVLPCLHEFHSGCVERWLQLWHQKTCPVCRFLVEDDHSSKGNEMNDPDMVLWLTCLLFL
ncbi:hypothetical protein Droror1_Dr00010956 [Drosera rotundifolia]